MSWPRKGASHNRSVKRPRNLVTTSGGELPPGWQSSAGTPCELPFGRAESTEGLRPEVPRQEEAEARYCLRVRGQGRVNVVPFRSRPVRMELSTSAAIRRSPQTCSRSRSVCCAPRSTPPICCELGGTGHRATPHAGCYRSPPRRLQGRGAMDRGELPGNRAAGLPNSSPETTLYVGRY